MKKILVACGSGIATSTVVVQKLGELLRARGLFVRIEQCKASEVESKVSAFDLVVSTTEVGDSKGKPIVRTVSFLTGIGIEKDIERIVKLLSA